MKRYRLWCHDSKLHKFVISRNGAFDENFMLQSIKEFIVNATILGEKTREQVELES